MLKLTETIETGEWCLFSFSDDFEEESFVFQIRFTGFEELNFDEVDEVEDLDDIDPSQNLYILSFEIVNLNKKKYESDTLKEKLILRMDDADEN